MLQAQLTEVGIEYHRAVKSLGAGLGGGKRRNTTVQRKRLREFKKRRTRFQRLRRSGVNMARLLRIGGNAAMTYGGAITGVSNTTLRQQRQASAVVAAVGGTHGGQQLDLALMLADESEGGRADPAFDAHMMPIGQWSLAVWESWLPLNGLYQLINVAKR